MYSEEESVERGAALLDKKVPDWAEKIQQAMFTGRFQMMHWDSCIAGTLELVRYGWSDPTGQIKAGTLGVGIALNGNLIVGEKEAASYGFYPADKHHSGSIWGDRMKELWKEQVNQRVRTPLPTEPGGQV